MKKTLRLEIKAISEKGEFEGWLSTFGNVDQGGDIVEAGAFTKTLKDKGNMRPLLWQHRADVPIGQILLEERKEGLWATGKLLLELPEAQKAYLLLKSGIINSMSIGFQSVKDAMEGAIRHLKEIKLFEGSIVTFPMNELALITGVKAAENKGDFNEELTTIQLFSLRYQMIDALATALDSIVWGKDLDREQRIAAAGTIIEQFSTAYLDFFPKYLDLLAERWGPMENWSREEFEKKAGAVFSTENKNSIRSIAQRAVSVSEDLLALISDEAGESTSEGKAANNPPEPEQAHSEVATLIEEIKGIIPKGEKKS